MKFLNLVTGFLYVVYDLMGVLINFLVGMFKTFLTNNRKNNAFIEFIHTPCFFTDFILYLAVFWVISAYSTIIALIVAVVFGPFWYEFKKKSWDNHNSSNFENHDDSLYWAYFMHLIVIIVAILYLNVNTPYSYEKVGSYTVTKGNVADALSRKKVGGYDTNIIINGWEEKVAIMDCKEGKTIILKETLEPIHIHYLNNDYILECSGEKQKITTIEEE